MIGRHSIDGNDVFTSFGFVVESGGNDFLKFPARKAPLSKSWPDQNGTEYDLDEPVFEERSMTITGVILADTVEQFWQYHKAFWSMWALPGKRRFYINAYQRSFYIFYNDSTGVTKLVPFPMYGPKKIGVRYIINVTEPKPSFWNPFAFLTDKNGNYLVTQNGGKLIVT